MVLDGLMLDVQDLSNLFVCKIIKFDIFFPNFEEIKGNLEKDMGSIILSLDIYSNNYKFWSDTFAIDIVSGIQESEQIVKEFKLKQNYPNPFNPSTTIEFTLPKTEWVTLNIYDLLGQKVSGLVADKLNSGFYRYSWQPGNLPSGIYYYRLQAGSFEQVRKMVFLK